jgi:hypothetical protein
MFDVHQPHVRFSTSCLEFGAELLDGHTLRLGRGCGQDWSRFLRWPAFGAPAFGARGSRFRLKAEATFLQNEAKVGRMTGPVITSK